MSDLETGSWFDPWVLPALAAGALLLYAYFAACLQVIARKTCTPGGWAAWVPVANLFLMARVGGVSVAWALGVLVPVLGLAAGCVLWAGIARARGRPAWFGLLLLVPGVNLLLPAVLALGDPAPVARASRCPDCGTAPEPGDLYCGQCSRDLRALDPRPPSPGRPGCAACTGIGCLGAPLLALAFAAWMALSPLDYAAPPRTPPLLEGEVARSLPPGALQGDLAGVLPASLPPGVRVAAVDLHESGRGGAGLDALAAVLPAEEVRFLARFERMLPGRALVARFEEPQGGVWTVSVLLYPEPRQARNAWNLARYTVAWEGVYTGLQDTYAMVRPSAGRTLLAFQKGPYLVVGATPPGRDYMPLHGILRTLQL